MLETIQRGRKVLPPQKIVLHGTQGIGKTTFGDTFESAVILPTEDGIGKLEASHFPVMTSYQQVVDAISALHGDHSFKTLVVDSLDWLEPLVWDETCRLGEKESIEAFGYAKGYTEADKQWRLLMGGFDSLRANRGMHVLLLAHSEVKNVTPPDNDAYDRYQLRLHKRAFALWTEWADIVGFLNYKIAVKKEKSGFNKERGRAVGSGDRVIYTTERPAYDAKNRWGLPDEIFIGKDPTYAAFHKALSEATNGAYTNNSKEDK